MAIKVDIFIIDIFGVLNTHKEVAAIVGEGCVEVDGHRTAVTLAHNVEVAAVDDGGAGFGLEGVDGGVAHFHEVNIRRADSGVGDIGGIGVECHALDGIPIYCRQVAGRDDELASGEVIEVEHICRNIAASTRSVIHGNFLCSRRATEGEA